MCDWLLVWFVGGHVRRMWVWWCIGIFLLEFWNLLCLKKTDLGCGLVRLGGPQGWVFEFCNANPLFEVGANEFWLHLVFLCVFPRFSDVYTFILISELAGIWILHFRWAHGTTDGIDSATGAKRPPAYAAQLLCSPAAGETGGRHNKTQNWFSSEENTRFGSARKLWFHPFRLVKRKRAKVNWELKQVQVQVGHDPVFVWNSVQHFSHSFIWDSWTFVCFFD